MVALQKTNTNCNCKNFQLDIKSNWFCTSYLESAEPASYFKGTKNDFLSKRERYE